MEVSVVKAYIRELIKNLIFTNDYQKMTKAEKKFLLVEGITDSKFLSKIVLDDVECKKVRDVCTSADPFRRNSAGNVREINCKEVIESVIVGLSAYPILVEAPSDAKDWPLYGLIDKDNDDEKRQLVPRLFITDTHDLETLMLKSDSDLLKRIGEQITEDDISKAFFLSYQIAVLRNTIRSCDPSFPIHLFSSLSIDSFDRFISQYSIITSELLKHIVDHYPESVSYSKSKISKLEVKIKSDKYYRKKLDKKTGEWEKKWETFNYSEVSDFWSVVNGHDILTFLRYVNHNARQTFANKGGYKLNREFELSLIDNYEYKMFAKTNIAQRMAEAQLISL